MLKYSLSRLLTYSLLAHLVASCLPTCIALRASILRGAPGAEDAPEASVVVPETGVVALETGVVALETGVVVLETGVVALETGVALCR